MFYLGIDYSSTNTALTFLHNNGELMYMTLFSPKDKNFDERIIKIVDNVMLEVNSYSREELIVGIESPSYFSKGKIIDLAAGYGYLKYNLLKEFQVFTFTPSSILKFATGKGKLPKSKDKKLKYDELYNLLPKEVKEELEKQNQKKWDDLIDSYWIAEFLRQIKESK